MMGLAQAMHISNGTALESKNAAESSWEVLAAEAAGVPGAQQPGRALARDRARRSELGPELGSVELGREKRWQDSGRNTELGQGGAQLHRAHLDLIHGRAQSCSVEETAVAALQRSAALLGVRRLNAPLAGHGGMREDDAAAASSDPALASSARRHNFPRGLWGASLDHNHTNAQILGHALSTPISARASALPPAATMTWRHGAGRRGRTPTASRGAESSALVSGHALARQAASAPSEHGGRG
jgi:hypothetical protein